MVKIINKEEFKNEILNDDKLCIVDFFATWCEPCRMLAPVVEAVSVDEEINNKVNFYKIDIDGNEDLAAEYKIEVVPTLIFLRNKEIIKTMEGYKEIEELKNAIKSVI